MKKTTRSQCVTLSVLLAMLALLVSLFPTQNSNEAADASRLTQQVSEAGMVKTTSAQLKN